MKRIVPGFGGSDHGIEDGQEFAHAGDDGNLFGFACGDEAVVELLDDGVESDGRERCHVESAAHLPASAEDGVVTSSSPRGLRRSRVPGTERPWVGTGPEGGCDALGA